jgi:hypothetical protein
MKKIMLIWSICFVVSAAFTLNQNVLSADKKAVSPSTKQIINISGEWEVTIQNLNAFSMYGTYPQIFKITQQGSSFTGIRLKDNPAPSYGKAGEKCIEGEVDKNGIKKIEMIDSSGNRLPAVCKISEDGKTMEIDAFDSVLPTHSQLAKIILRRK